MFQQGALFEDERKRFDPAKPLKTESKMIIAATGIATATTLSPEIRLTTERDLGEKR